MGLFTNTSTPGHSVLGSNGNEGVTLLFPQLQNWSLTTRCSLLSYPRHLGLNWFIIKLNSKDFFNFDASFQRDGEYKTCLRLLHHTPITSVENCKFSIYCLLEYDWLFWGRTVSACPNCYLSETRKGISLFFWVFSAQAEGSARLALFALWAFVYSHLTLDSYFSKVA